MFLLLLLIYFKICSLCRNKYGYGHWNRHLHDAGSGISVGQRMMSLLAVVNVIRILWKY
jgi:hypothetical protein